MEAFTDKHHYSRISTIAPLYSVPSTLHEYIQYATYHSQIKTLYAVEQVTI